MYKLLIIPLLILFASCSAGQVALHQKRFNEGAFPGLVRMAPDGKSILLDYELDGADGQPISFSSCSQVNAVRDEAVIPHQFNLLRLLKINCRAARLFLNSEPYSRSFFPEKMTQSFAPQLPAQAVPDRGGDALEMRKGTLLGRYEKDLRIDNLDGERLTVTLSGGDEITYVILARADMDGDHHEDWIVRLDWSSPDSFGDGSDLIVLSKSSKEGNYEINWRYE